MGREGKRSMVDFQYMRKMMDPSYNVWGRGNICPKRKKHDHFVREHANILALRWTVYLVRLKLNCLVFTLKRISASSWAPLRIEGNFFCPHPSQRAKKYVVSFLHECVVKRNSLTEKLIHILGKERRRKVCCRCWEPPVHFNVTQK